MKTIKILFLTLLTAFLICLGAACESHSNRYKLTVNDPYGYLLSELSDLAEEYEAGEEVSVKVAGLSGVSLYVYVNDREITDRETVNTDGWFYETYMFVMPARDSVLTIDVHTIIPPIIEEAEFTVNYDYGQHIQTSDGQGLATILLNGCSLFFDPYDYDIEMPLLAGDVLTVYYTGEMLIQETYPATVVIQNGSIEHVEKSKKATLVSLETRNGELYTQDGVVVADMPKYALNADRTYLSVEEAIESGKAVHGSLVDTVTAPSQPNTSEGVLAGVKLAAIYTYHPEYTVQMQDILPKFNALNAEHVTKLEKTFYNGSVGPNGLITKEYTTNQKDIAAFLAYLQTLTFMWIPNTQQIDGGGTVIYTLYTANGKVEYTTYAGNYCTKEYTFIPVSAPPIFECQERTYRFQTYLDTCDLYIDGVHASTLENFLGELEFKPVNEFPDFPTKKYVLAWEGKNLYLIDETHFAIETGTSMGTVVYKVVSEQTFSHIFNGYILSVIGATDCLVNSLSPAYLAGEEITVTTHVLMDACIFLYLNGESLGMGNDVEIEREYYWTFTFKMPPKDSVLFVSVENGFIPPEESIAFTQTHYAWNNFEADNRHLLCTADELAAYLDGDDANGDTAAHLLEEYGEEYFSTRNLLVFSYTVTSPSLTGQVDSIVITHDGRGDVVTVVIDVKELGEGEEGDCAMQMYKVFIEIPKYYRIRKNNITVKFI